MVWPLGMDGWRDPRTCRNVPARWQLWSAEGQRAGGYSLPTKNEVRVILHICAGFPPYPEQKRTEDSCSARSPNRISPSSREPTEPTHSQAGPVNSILFLVPYLGFLIIASFLSCRQCRYLPHSPPLPQASWPCTLLIRAVSILDCSVTALGHEN